MISFRMRIWGRRSLKSHGLLATMGLHERCLIAIHIVDTGCGLAIIPSTNPSNSKGRPVSNPVTIAFGVYQLDLAHEELRRLGTPLRMQPQPFKLLVFLASRAGEIVSREDIEKEIWGEDTFVDFERGLNHCVRQVRAVLGDDATAPRYIETVPRRGYRFIAPAKFVDAADPSAAATAQPADSPTGPARPEWRRNRLWIGALNRHDGLSLGLVRDESGALPAFFWAIICRRRFNRIVVRCGTIRDNCHGSKSRVGFNVGIWISIKKYRDMVPQGMGRLWESRSRA